MLKLFSKTAFPLLQNSSRLPPKSFKLYQQHQLFSFSTYKALNWDQCFSYTSILNETSFQKALPALKNFPNEEILDFQNVWNEYIAHKDPSLLSEKDAKNLSIIIWKMGSLAQSARNAPESEAYYLEALDIVKKSKANNPGTVIMIQNNLGWLYYNMNQLDKSLICLEDVCNMIEEIPDFVDFDSVRVRNLYFTSKVLTRQGKQNEAIDLLHKMITVIDNDPRSPPTYLTTSAFNDLGQIYQEKNLEEAFKMWKEGIRYAQLRYGDAPDGLQDLYRSVGEAYFEQENDALVIENMKRCIELSKKHNKVNFIDFYTLAVAQQALEDYEGFLQNAQTFLDLTGEYQPAKKAFIYELLCRTHYKHSKNITLAEKSFGSLVPVLKELYGENASEIFKAYMERVELLSEQEALKGYYRAALVEACQVGEKCQKLDPKIMVNLLFRAGESYANDEEWAQALEYFEKVQKPSPEKYLAQEGDQLEYVNLITAKTYCFLGRFQEGLVYAEKAKALCKAAGDPTNRMADLDESIKHIHESIKNT